jgi:F-type H+-transporting ATPase subunit delta
MSTFIGQLVGFAVIVLLLVKYVLPPVRTMMRKQQEAVLAALEESTSAAKQLESADEEHAKAVERARHDGSRVTEEARSDSARIAALAQEQAAIDAERIKAQGSQHVNLLHQQKIRELRAELGVESMRRAEFLVREHVADPVAQSATVDRFLDELDAMPATAKPPSAAFDAGAKLNLRATSREALAGVVETFEDVAQSLDYEGLTTLADELSASARLLHSRPTLTRALTKPTADAPGRVSLLRKLFEGKVGAPALEVLSAAAAQRWSADDDVVDAVEHAAKLALVVRAERNGESKAVEEQLFRVGRILNASPRLSTLLSDFNAPAHGRIGLLDKLLDTTGVTGTAAAMLRQTVELMRGQRADHAVFDLGELAVARRGELVAHVAAAADLTDQQKTRLSRTLSRVYGHPVSIQTEVDKALLGGLIITVGGEVIDGAISSRVAAARTGLPD